MDDSGPHDRPQAPNIFPATAAGSADLHRGPGRDGRRLASAGRTEGIGYTATIYSMYNCTNQELTSEELAHPWSIGDGGYDFSSQWLAYGTADACTDTVGP